MSIRVTSYVREETGRFPQSGGALNVLLWLADRAKDDGTCFPSIHDIATHCRMSDRQVQRHLARLQQDRALSIIAPGGGRRNGGKYPSNWYQIVGPWCEDGNPIPPADHTDDQEKCGQADRFYGGQKVDVSRDVVASLASPLRCSGDISGNVAVTSMPMRGDMGDTRTVMEPSERTVIPVEVACTVGEGGVGGVRQGSGEPAPTDRMSSSHALKEGRPASRQRATRLPEGWMPSESDQSKIAEEYPDLDMDRATEEWRDHWRAQAGAKGCKTDWAATWRNGMRLADSWGRHLLVRGDTAGDSIRRQMAREGYDPFLPGDQWAKSAGRGGGGGPINVTPDFNPFDDFTGEEGVEESSPEFPQTGKGVGSPSMPLNGDEYSEGSTLPLAPAEAEAQICPFTAAEINEIDAVAKARLREQIGDVNPRNRAVVNTYNNLRSDVVREFVKRRAEELAAAGELTATAN